MKHTKKCKVIKNPCLICYEPVTLRNGLQCKGACQRWAHFQCLDYTRGKIQDIKAGTIQVNCPCPLCDTTGPKEILTNTHKCDNKGCPSNNPPKCPGSGNSSPHFDLCPPALPQDYSLPPKHPDVNANKSNSSGSTGEKLKPSPPSTRTKPFSHSTKMPCHPSCGSKSRSQAQITSSIASDADTLVESKTESAEEKKAAIPETDTETEMDSEIETEAEPEAVTSSSCDEDGLKRQLKRMLKKIEKLTCIVGKMNCELKYYNKQNNK